MTDSNECERYVQRALTTRLLAEQTVSELAHLPVGAIAIVLVWGSLPHAALTVWFALLVATSLVRRAMRRRLLRAIDADGRVAPALRATIVAVAVVWGLGVALAAPRVPPVQVALLLLIGCGLTAAATSTLLADPLAFGAYTGALLLLSAAGLITRVADREFAVSLALIVLFGTVMAALYRRLRRTLVHSLITQFELEESRSAADRERAFLDRVIEGAPAPIVILDASSAVQRANPAFERLFGYSEDEARGRILDDLVVPVEGRETAAAIQRQVHAGVVVQTDVERCRKDGTSIFTRVVASHIPETGGTFVVYDDVTQRRRAEQALRESEARLFKTLASLPVGIVVTDADGVPFFANDAATALIGDGVLPPRSVDNLAAEYNAFVAGTGRPYPNERMPIARALAGEATTVDDMEIRRGGRAINLEMFGSPIRDRGGEIVFAVAAFTNITERRRTAAALHSARIAAEEATAAKSAFLANMSHEIRTPLNGILGLAELLMGDELAPEHLHSIELIASSGETLLHVINDILDFSKIEAGQLDIEAAPLDLASIVESTARLLMPKAIEKQIEIITEIEDRVPPTMLGDPTRIRQVMTNLVANAVKFTDRGDVVVSLSCAAEPTGTARVRLAVADTGPGIPADKLGTIFDAFRQADATTTRRYGGTGLGLSISRRLVELMGGSLTVESVLGKGSTFRFELELPVVDGAAQSYRAPGRLMGLRVLVVDDNATNRRVMRGSFESGGCAVSEAANGADAIVALRAAHDRGRPFQLLVTDLLMPDIDGFELVRTVRGDPAIASTPTIMLTSITRVGDSQRCRDLAIAACLVKPASRRELLATARAATGEAAPQPATRRRSPAPRVVLPRESLRVLLAEDNVVNQEVAAAVLRRRGHDVTVVGDGRAAVALATSRRFDVVLMDLQMPVLDGLEATAGIRAELGATSPRIVALTANAMTGERERCLAAGMDGYLSKPFRGADLITVVEHRGDTPAAGVPTVPASSLPVDLRTLKRELELGGVGEIYDDILAVFTRDADLRMDALRAAVDAGVGTSIERAAHAFKSAAATIRAGRLAERLGSLERAARSGTIDDIAERLADIEEAFAGVQRQLDPSHERGLK